MKWRLRVRDAAERAAEMLEDLGLAIPTAVDAAARVLTFDSDVESSARDDREIDEVVCALWDTEAEVVAVRPE